MCVFNILIIIFDEYCKDVMGCVGYLIVKILNLDVLVVCGIFFVNVYMFLLMCVLMWVVIVIGDYVYKIGNWDSVMFFNGIFCSWMC